MTRKTWFTVIAIGCSLIYECARRLDVAKPVISPIEEKIGGGTFIEIVLGLLIVYFLVRKEEQPSGHVFERVAPRTSRTVPSYGMKAPNVVAKDARLAWVKGVSNVLFEREEYAGNRALIVEFRNEPTEGFPSTWNDVRASIGFYNENGSEVADVGRASWLEEIRTVVSLSSHVTRRLLVAAQIADGTWFSYDGAGGSITVIPKDIKRAKIVLHDNKHHSLVFTLALDLTHHSLSSLISKAPCE